MGKQSNLVRKKEKKQFYEARAGNAIFRLYRAPARLLPHFDTATLYGPAYTASLFSRLLSVMRDKKEARRDEGNTRESVGCKTRLAEILH